MFLLANNNIKVILKIFFLIFSNVNIQFIKKKLIWKFYTIIKAMLIIKQVKFINKKEFAKVVLDEKVKIFVIYVIFLLTMTIYLIRKIQIALLLIEKVIILKKYSDFSKVFFKKNISVLLKIIKLN